MFERIILMLFAHAVGDAALQTQWMATYKHANSPFHAHGKEYPHFWIFVLASHALTCGAMVYLFSGGLIWIGVIEAVSHFIVDYGSTHRWWNFGIDQGLHLLTKILLVLIWI